MTGKYTEFKNDSGIILKGKLNFCIANELPHMYALEKLRAKRKEGSFILNGITWNFKLVYANPEPRAYIPNPKGLTKKEKPTHYTKVVGNMEMVYSSISNRLISSRSLMSETG